MFRVLVTILLLLPFQFVSSIMRPSGWPHKKNSFTLYGLTSGMVQGGIWTPVYWHTLATHGNSEWTVFMSLTRMGP